MVDKAIVRIDFCDVQNSKRAILVDMPIPHHFRDGYDELVRNDGGLLH